MFTPCTKDKIEFSDLIFFVCRNLMQKKQNPYNKDSVTRNDRYIAIKRVTYIII